MLDDLSNSLFKMYDFILIFFFFCICYLYCSRWSGCYLKLSLYINSYRRSIRGLTSMTSSETLTVSITFYFEYNTPIIIVPNNYNQLFKYLFLFLYESLFLNL